MDVSAVNSGAGGDIFGIIGNATEKSVEMTEKMAQINIEQNMEQDKRAMAEDALIDFYA